MFAELQKNLNKPFYLPQEGLFASKWGTAGAVDEDVQIKSVFRAYEKNYLSSSHVRPRANISHRRYIAFIYRMSEANISRLPLFPRFLHLPNTKG